MSPAPRPPVLNFAPCVASGSSASLARRAAASSAARALLIARTAACVHRSSNSFSAKLIMSASDWVSGRFAGGVARRDGLSRFIRQFAGPPSPDSPRRPNVPLNRRHAALPFLPALRRVDHELRGFYMGVPAHHVHGAVPKDGGDNATVDAGAKHFVAAGVQFKIVEPENPQRRQVFGQRPTPARCCAADWDLPARRKSGRRIFCGPWLERATSR